MDWSMLAIALSFLVGMAQLLWLPTLKISWVFFCLIFIGLALFVKHKYAKLMLSTVLGFSFAIVAGLYAKSQQLQTIPTANITLLGSIVDLPKQQQDRTKFTFKVENHKLKKLLVSWYDTEQQVRAGQKWQLELKLKPIHGYNNPGSFDYSKWLFRQGYDATATVKSAKLLPKQSINISAWVNNLRFEIGEVINQNIKSVRVQALIQALTIGDKSQISFADSQLFQTTGTAHLIAISGLHIGLIALVGVFFGRLCFFVFTSQKFNRYKFEAIFAISFALFYALLAGLSIPTIRALVMVIVFSLAHVFKTSISRWQAWSIALMIILVIDPFSVLDIGFWFSFGAVAVLMFAFTGRKSSNNFISAFIKAQVIILLGLMPLMVIVFQKVTILSPVANILILPLASLLLIPLIFISIFVYTFSATMAGFLFTYIEKLSLYLFAILDYLQQLDYVNLTINNINPFTFGLLLLAAIALLLPKLFRWRFIAVVLLLPLFLIKSNNITEHEFRVNVLDVGQGLSIIVTTKKHTLIYDTGAKFEAGFSLATSVVLPFLQSKGITAVDKIILSHKDNDHAGGIDELRKSFPNAEVLAVTGEYPTCVYPKSWTWDEVKFEVLSPYNTNPYLGNNSSCVIKISSNNGSILLTGDIHEPIEYRLLQNFSEQITSDVLIIPHHGSKTSSSKDFITQVNPKTAINSSGFANQFNHPHPHIKQAYLTNGSEFLDTQDQGMIELLFQNSNISILSYQQSNKHFWQVVKSKRH
ncbi:MAG: DNA internalization-related competence protein ComEC/Rec2 [Proteobacteria bacterium]|nr:DNA internalization-related competence protein ComEC/Rec2 [Pseudomonadota bacterium]